MTFKQGDMVLVGGKVLSSVFDFTENATDVELELLKTSLGKVPRKGTYRRLLWTEERNAVKCIVLGWTLRKTGYIEVKYEDGYEFRSFVPTGTVKCWMVMPLSLSNNSQYCVPFPALEEHIELYQLSS